MHHEIKLKVAEAIQDDVNKGIVRIDSSFMHELGIRPGEIIEITGERKTVAIADRAYPGDIGLNIIRMDGLVRRNAKAGIGEIATIKKANIVEAKKVTIAPQRKGIVIRANPVIFKQGLLGRAVLKGDIVSLGGSTRRRSAMSANPMFGEEVFNMLDESLMGFGLGDLKFVVVETNPKQPVVITEQTEVQFNPEATEVSEEKMLEVTYEDIGGLEDELRKVREMVELPLKHPELFEALGIEPPKGVLLHGPPGTGKTMLAKAVANETAANFFLINGPEIMSKYYGQSEENLRKKFEEAEKNAPSIIFIDEIDAIASKREESKGEVERRVVAQMLALMDGLKSRGKVVVIGATNIPNELDPALRRPGRFDRELEIGVPDKDGRLNILKIHTRNMPMTKNVNLKEIAEITHGFVGADLSALAKEAAMNLLRTIYPDLKLEEDKPIPKEVLEKLRVSKNDFMEALKVVRPSALREVLIELPNVKWMDVGGLGDVKQELIEAVEWPLQQPAVFTRMGISPPKGILLYGPPGTGKTLLAKAVASESKANFILVKGPELLSKWVGESEKAVRKIFEKARQASPTIIFFDEIDSLAPRRGMENDSHASERVVNQLLTEMDGMVGLHNIVIIGATNRPDIIDTALLRPGRFDRIILVSGPDVKSRLEILKIHTKGMPIGVSKDELEELDSFIKDSSLARDIKTNVASKMAGDESVKESEVNKKKPAQKVTGAEKQKLTDVEKLLYYIAENSEGYAGADLESVCREAAMLALRKDIKADKITKANFSDALKKVSPSITKEIEEAYAELKSQFKSARGKEMKETKPAYYG